VHTSSTDYVRARATMTSATICWKLSHVCVNHVGTITASPMSRVRVSLHFRKWDSRAWPEHGPNLYATL